ncbi:hypothetical protein KKA14_01515 [bacterium]|nr:hypothetical protein [bacterium]
MHLKQHIIFFVSSLFLWICTSTFQVYGFANIDSEVGCDFKYTDFKPFKETYTCKLRLNKGLPDYELKFYYLNDENTHRIEKLEIYDSKRALIQVIFKDLEELPSQNYNLYKAIRLIDINFDGYSDLILRTPVGTGLFSNDTVWIFNREQSIFTYLGIFGEIKTSSNLKQIYSYNKDYLAIFQLVDNKVELVEERETNRFKNDGEFDLTIIKRKDSGKMIKVGEKYYLNGQGPISEKFRNELFEIHQKAIELYKNEEINKAIDEFRPYFEKIDIGSLNTLAKKNKNEVLSAVNDFGFFLEQGGFFEDSISLLKKVKSIDKERTVVYLNLADSQYKLSQVYENRSSRRVLEDYSKQFYYYIPPRSFEKLVKASLVSILFVE